MKKYILVLFALLLIQHLAYNQKNLNQHIDVQIQQLDSMNRKYDSLKRIQNRYKDSIWKAEEDSLLKLTLKKSNNNLAAFLANQKKQKDRQFYQSLIRFSILLGLVFVLIIAGIIKRRRRADSKKQ